ncbi:hypothetical protein K1W69_19070 [Hoeflea sp. WL0058]|uniref:Uncharacterized protein n=1 Tax=Flavimaribacter sediminis TaxID=2865987 RepID=A0AAE2ZLX9_9HYPH|nr:hypothetical protein [Flavimaribacter sediminis]MBW8639304.1 hypothetical protein [Flavimaribacter sediminis]
MVEADRPLQTTPRDGREPLVDELIDWMVNGARPSASAKAIIRCICERLLEIGVPIDRFALFIFTLHPNLQGRRFRWFRDGDVDIAEAPMGMFSTEIYRANPIPHVIECGESIRRHLEDPDCPEDYLIVGELREQGLTDYLAVPLVFTTGETHVGA